MNISIPLKLVAIYYDRITNIYFQHLKCIMKTWFLNLALVLEKHLQFRIKMLLYKKPRNYTMKTFKPVNCSGCWLSETSVTWRLILRDLEWRNLLLNIYIYIYIHRNQTTSEFFFFFHTLKPFNNKIYQVQYHLFFFFFKLC